MTSREAGQDGTLEPKSCLVIETPSIKEESIENSFSGNQQNSNKKGTTPQRRINSGQLETTSSTNSASQNDSTQHPSGNQIHHLQYMSPYGERNLPSNGQQESFTHPALPNGCISSEQDRHMKGTHLSSSSNDSLEYPIALSPSHTGNILMNNTDMGMSSLSPLKRNHNTNKPSANDPLSHRIIEKRRRDRMNNCLADLSRLIPTYYLKKGRGRIEKTEIIEMAIKYMKHLQAHACNQIETCEITTKQEIASKELDHFQMGYQEAMSETLEFLRDSEGLYSGDSLCVRIMNHLTKHCEKIVKNEAYPNLKLSGSLCSSSSSSGYHANGSSSNGSSSDGNGSSSNLGSDSKDGLLTEESAYRSEDPVCSDDLEATFTPTGCGASEAIPQGASGGYHPSSGPGSNNSSSGDDNNNNRLYKFKSNMKHRFSADAEHSQVKKKRRDSDSFTSSRQSPFTQVPSNHSPSKPQSENAIPSPLSGNTKAETDCSSTVPIFALSSNGEFYIPLSLDQSLIAPFIASQADVITTPILHPVSIHVSFCTAPISPQLPLGQSQSLPAAQDPVMPSLEQYNNPYSNRNVKEERRRHQNQPVHTHFTFPKRDYIYPPPTDIRNFRNGGTLPELQPLSHGGMTHYPLDQRDYMSRHQMREYHHNKYQSKGQIWSHHMTPSFKD